MGERNGLRYRFGLITVLLVAAILCGCAAKEEGFDNLGVAKEFWKNWDNEAITGHGFGDITQAYYEELMDGKLFTEFAIRYFDERGSRNQLATVYPYMREAILSDGKSTEWVADEVLGHADEYLAELIALRDYYNEHTKLATLCLKENGLYIVKGTGYGNTPKEPDVLGWLSDEKNLEFLKAMEEVVKTRYSVSTRATEWTAKNLTEYFGTSDYHASDPQPNTFTLIYDATGGEAAPYPPQDHRDGLENASIYKYSDDPDRAQVFIYYHHEYETSEYIEVGGTKMMRLYVGTDYYTAVDAVTGETIASYEHYGRRGQGTEYAKPGTTAKYLEPTLTGMNYDTRCQDFFGALKQYYAGK